MCESKQNCHFLRKQGEGGRKGDEEGKDSHVRVRVRVRV